ncbi:MAG: hypothetical protein ACK5HS_01115 [Mycoplasmatales bacterium]
MSVVLLLRWVKYSYVFQDIIDPDVPDTSDPTTTSPDVDSKDELASIGKNIFTTILALCILIIILEAMLINPNNEHK